VKLDLKDLDGSHSKSSQPEPGAAAPIRLTLRTWGEVYLVGAEIRETQQGQGTFTGAARNPGTHFRLWEVMSDASPARVCGARRCTDALGE
jgi:hypothetical protein